MLRYNRDIAGWTLAETPTRELMKIRDLCYKFGGAYSPCDSSCGPFIKLPDVLAELNRREHVPNKKEAEQLRRDKARKNRHDRRRSERFRMARR